ncbi:WSC domain-containing protein, partial [Lasiosphaeria miniovina]
PASVGNGAQGPCPGEGYTCNDCLDGWFCPPSHTPALPAPCGNGWPCYHCSGGWFCVPSPTLLPTTVTVCPLSQAGSTTPGAGLTTPSTPGDGEQTPAAADSAGALPQETLHPAISGWQYAGCYKDDSARALQNASITVSIPPGMTNEMCINFCKDQGFSLAGTEDGYQCFCGNALVDSWPVGDSECNAPCTGDPNCSCGGNWALSVWSPDGKASRVIGPEMQFVMPTPTPGQTEMTLFVGGVRAMVMTITTDVFEFPADIKDATTTSSLTPVALSTANAFVDSDSVAAKDLDVDGIASTVHAIVSAAMKEAHQIASIEVLRANSMISGAKSVVG